ncbi:MAG TPA: DUF5808 domain-containing protein [Verrucomicrobiae bacterium]|nr:DUF5808 domain-containing protein [Verrucomicrobiae bacterium]
MNSTSLNWILIFAALLPWVAIAVGMLMTPRRTRPDLFFAVTVNPSFQTSPLGNEIVRQYNRLVIIVALVALLPIGLIPLSPRLMLVGLIAPTLIQIAGGLGALLMARHRTLPHRVQPTSEREADLTPRHASLAGGWLAQAGPFLILAVFAICLWLNWDRVPARFPIHWGLDGKPNGWGVKSFGSVFGIWITSVFLCLFICGIQYMTVYGAVTARINNVRDGMPQARFVRAISWFLLGVEYWLALLVGLLSLLPLRSSQQLPLPIIWPILLGQTLIIATIFIIAYRMGQGGWRLQTEGEKINADACPIGDRTPDECWKLGVFYFNRTDPALFVEKRFGVGWTLNMARPGAWAFLGAILLLSVGSVVIGICASR